MSESSEEIIGEKIAFKLGSGSNTDRGGIRIDRLNHYAEQFAEQFESGNLPVAILSGAVATANALLLSDEEREDENITLQMRATRGNPVFMAIWSSALDKKGLHAGELLVTHHELVYPPEAKSFVHTIEDYWDAGWLPLINESSSTDNQETNKLIYGGDNDGMAEAVADKANTDRVCFLMEEEGLIAVDGQLIRTVNPDNLAEVEAALEEADRKEATIRSLPVAPTLGSGGIRSKVEAAIKAANKRRPAHIAHARHSFKAVLKQEVGTYFVPGEGAYIVE